jgi:hypothetical protein
MALGAAAVLTANSSSANQGQSTPFTTASVTMTAGRATFVAISHSGTATEVAPTSVASASVTFTKFAGAEVAWSTAARHISLWYATPGSTVTEAIVITLPDDGTGCSWIVFEKTGAAATPVVGTPVTATDTDADIAATHGALQSANNDLIGIVAYAINNTTDSPSGTDWAPVTGAATSYGTPSSCLELAENVAGVTQQLTYSGSGAAARGLVIVEIAAAAAGVTMGDLPVATIGLSVGGGSDLVVEPTSTGTSTPRLSLGLGISL